MRSSRMPRFFLHLRDGDTICDDDGLIFASPEEARQEAVRAARDMMADQVRQGRLSLKDRIEVEDEGGNTVVTVTFREAVDLHE
jgi:hypothetical protein